MAMPTLTVWSVLIVCMLATTAALAEWRVEARAMPEPEATPYRAPWVGAADADWSAGEPTFTVAAEEGGPAVARGWVAVTDQHVKLKLAVEDDQHVAAPEGGDLWRGDAIQIGIDAHGDTPAPALGRPGPLEPHVGSITIAGTPEAPRVWAHFQGKYGSGYLSDGARDYPLAIEREEENERTTYTLSLPWAEFDTPAGLYPQVGLAVQINDRDAADEREPASVEWGGGAGGRPSPWRFNRIAIEAKPGVRVAAIECRKTILIHPADRAELRIAYAGDEADAVRLEIGGETAATIETPETDGRIARQRVTLRSSATLEGAQPLTVRFNRADARAEAELEPAYAVIDRLTRRLLALAEEAEPALFAHHLRSVAAVVKAEWNRAVAVAVAGETPAVAADDLARIRPMLEGFAGDAAAWESYLNGERPLILSWVSPHDRTLQFCQVFLPRGWEPERAYPLFLELHGAGDANPLGMVARRFGPEPSPDAERTIAMIRRDGYAVMPWGRGNSGYTGVGEVDVWEAVAEVEQWFELDEDRRYLYGFSMGAGGTWAIASRTPDRWAALGIFSAGTWAAPLGIGLGENLSHMPVRLAVGENDFFRNSTEGIRDELKEAGGPVEFELLPGLGHNYDGGAQVRMYEFLRRHTRVRPAAFTFIADTRRHTGVWGVRMRRHPDRSAWPRMEVRIDGRRVEIDTEHTDGLEVVLGEGGLGLSGEVTVVWNGEQSYAGPVKTIELGEGPGGSRW